MATIKATMCLVSGILFAQASYAEGTIFDPDGYYFPIKKVYIQGLRIQRLDVSTLEYYYDGKEVHYDKIIPHPPKIYVMLTDKNDDGVIPFSCDEITIKPDKVFFKCKETLIGDIIFEGYFIDKRGQYWNYISDMQTPVLKTTITIKNDNKITHRDEYTFGYWEGD